MTCHQSESYLFFYFFQKKGSYFIKVIQLDYFIYSGSTSYILYYCCNGWCYSPLDFLSPELVSIKSQLIIPHGNWVPQVTSVCVDQTIIAEAYCLCGNNKNLFKRVGYKDITN